MTVKELSDALAGFPDSAEVVVPRVFGGRAVPDEFRPADVEFKSSAGVAGGGVVAYVPAVVLTGIER